MLWKTLWKQKIGLAGVSRLRFAEVPQILIVIHVAST
jgi:hypothetical protein